MVVATKTMQAVVLTAPGVVEQQRVPVPAQPQGDQVLLRVTRAGICGSGRATTHPQ